METTIPFSGFYYSIHDQELDFALDSIFSDSNGDPYPTIRDKAFELVQWSCVHNMYARKYTEAFKEKFNIDVTFKLLSSPKYYNFETDRIVTDISEDEVLRLWKEIDRDMLQTLIKKKFTSCDGFISFYKNDLDSWPEDVTEWDLNQIGTLIQCYVNQESKFTLIEESQLLTYPYEVATTCIYENIENAERLFKLAEYLRLREERN